MPKEVRINRNIRMTEDEWQDFRELLGAEWLRSEIAKAKARANRKPTAQKPEPDQKA